VCACQRVTAVEEREIVLQSGERVPYGLCVWAAGACRYHSFITTGPLSSPWRLVRHVLDSISARL
jgi:NADH dehydrogenase FAD-containing subunit